MSASESRPVGYVSDVEGNAAYFCRYVDESSIVEFTDRPPAEPAVVGSSGNVGHLPALRFTADADARGAVFVFGGDVCDKGNGDLRVIKALLEFKVSAPDRVFLLVGNRDVNKLRLSSELADPCAPADMFPEYWVDPTKRSPYPDYLAKAQLQDGPAARLKWVLDCTMGSGGAFERRRQELAILAGLDSPDPITDAQVYASYVGSAAKGGLLYKYLRVAQIGAVIDGRLFVHGGVNEKNMGYVPPADGTTLSYTPCPGTPDHDSGAGAPAEGIPDVPVAEWIAGLNAWYTAQLDAYDAAPQWLDAPARTARGGNALMDYGVPGGIGGRGVMYTSYLVDGTATVPEPRVLDYLAASNISVVITGHTPHGQSPSVLVPPDPAAPTFVICDTSYSDMSAEDNRGVAVSEVEVVGPHRGDVRVHGVDAGGQAHDFVVADDPYIGRTSPDGFLVKSKAVDSDVYTLAQTKGFAVRVETAAAAQIPGILADGFDPV